MTALSTNDPTSFSIPEAVLVTHIHVDLDIDFSKHVLSGCVQLKLTQVQESAKILVLDTNNLKIHSVTDVSSGQPLEYTLGEHVGVFGSKLEVTLPNGNIDAIKISYETSPHCSALQWLRPEQTAGNRYPYMFSQCQAIHCRSLLPCQDTPSVKCAYTASISAPKELTVLMSALLEGSSPSSKDDSKKISTFKQETPMPAYLIAIVAGDLVSKDIGPRSKVWTESELVEKAAYEFAETEEMLKIAEELLGPYVWGHYDLLVLPPSFPYGGMENPCLTFVTPTLLAGDRSLADVVAHEIAHSWTGNLVTNKTFEDFWLNEGNTKYVERAVVSRLKGGEKYRQLLAKTGWNILTDTVNVLGKEHPYTCLRPDLRGVDPDDAFSSIPYEKGHALLFYLESLVGGPAVFEAFLKAYIEEFKYKSIDAQDWKNFLLSYFAKKAADGVFDEVDWDTWFTGVGMPPVKPKYDTSLLEACTALGQRWLESSDDGLNQFTSADISSFHTIQVTEFLSTFLDKDPLSSAKLKALGDVYKLKGVNNAEIKLRWLRVCIKARNVDVIPEALKFVTEQGRMKFIVPIYRDLYEWEESRAYAISNFQSNKHQMHSTSVNAVSKVLKLPQDA